MSNDDFAKHLYEASTSLSPQMTKLEWWRAIADAAEGYLAEALIKEELGGREVSQRETPAPLVLEEPLSDKQWDSGQRPEDYNYQQDAAAASTLNTNPVAWIEQEPSVMVTLPEQTAPGHSEVAPPGSDIGHRSAAHRTLCSERAFTGKGYQLDRHWRPSRYGYTLENLRADYPHIDPEGVLESFFQHFISKGESSRNWMEKFFWFCTNGERMAKERAETGTDSMGQPLDRNERIARRRAEVEHAREQEEFYQQSIQREGQQP